MKSEREENLLQVQISSCLFRFELFRANWFFLQTELPPQLLGEVLIGGGLFVWEWVICLYTVGSDRLAPPSWPLHPDPRS